MGVSLVLIMTYIYEVVSENRKESKIALGQVIKNNFNGETNAYLRQCNIV